MNAPADLRQQLQTLRIAGKQRPQPMARGGAGRGLAWGVVLLLLAGAGAAAWTYREPLLAKVKDLAGPAAVEVPTLTVRAVSQPATNPVLTATGKIVSDHRVEVSTKVSGQIVGLYFEQGDRIEKGQVLARIEDTNYRALRDEAAAMLETSRADQAFRRFEFERITGLFSTGRATEMERAEAQHGFDAANARVEAAEARLAFAAKTLADCEVQAPIAGVILERNVEVGDFVAAEGGRGANANAQFGAIADMTKLRVEIDVSELDISRIGAGMSCTVVPDAYKDRRYSGRVMWIDPGANYAKATVQAKVRIEQPDEHLRVEGSAQVLFLPEATASAVGTAAPAIWIPIAACQVEPSGASGHVFLVQQGRLRRTAVQLGRNNGSQVEVTAGLQEGALIAASGLEKLADGQSIK